MMDVVTGSAEKKLSRQETSDAVGHLGWRFLLGALHTSVPVNSLVQGMHVASSAAVACGDDADRHLSIDIRPRLVILTLQARDQATVTVRDVELARWISGVVQEDGLRTAPGVRTEPGIDEPALRSVQLLEIAVDALDIPAVRPFWKVVFGYVAEPGADGSEGALVDPLGQGPVIWFQQMDRPRPQRNRIHFDLCVPHDEAPERIQAALAAGGHLVSADRAPAFWVLADAEGNEVCVTTWQGREG